MSDVYAILASSGYEPTIGLEVHVQLNTKTKIFSSDPNGMADEPNTQVSPTSLGLPGSLPVLNEQAVHKAIQFGLAVHAQINSEIYFDRKSYFYPDLPKGFQTTQDKAPICIGGRVEAFEADWEGEEVALHHTHLEEDAGKSSHDNGEFTNIDLNRAGSPLIEIVTEPCIRSGRVAAAFLQEIRRIVRFLDISHANMEKGELRCDANISIKRIGDKKLGHKVEIKNMNSFSHVRKAIDFELARQFELVTNGEQVQVETRTFDVGSGETFGMRFKETLNDYRYFPCPDLPPVMISKEMIHAVKMSMIQTPKEVRDFFRSNYELKESVIAFLCQDSDTSVFAKSLIEATGESSKTINWMQGPIQAYCNDQEIKMTHLPRPVKDIAELIQMEIDEKLTKASAQLLFLKMMNSQKSAEDLAEEEGVLLVDDADELERIVSSVLLSLPREVEQYKQGKKQLFGLFMGEIMKKGGRKLNPKQIQEQLRKELSE